MSKDNLFFLGISPLAVVDHINKESQRINLKAIYVVLIDEEGHPYLPGSGHLSDLSIASLLIQTYAQDVLRGG